MPKYGILHSRIHKDRIIITDWDTYMNILPHFFGPKYLSKLDITEAKNPWEWVYWGDIRNAFFEQNLDKWERDMMLDTYPVYFYTKDMFKELL